MHLLRHEIKGIDLPHDIELFPTCLLKDEKAFFRIDYFYDLQEKMDLNMLIPDICSSTLKFFDPVLLRFFNPSKKIEYGYLQIVFFRVNVP